MTKPRLFVFASGSATDGGSGFEKLVEASHNGVLRADIVGVASNHAEGGVSKRARKLGVPFFHFVGSKDGEGYQNIARHSRADFFALSGWLKLVTGLDPKTNFNSKTVFNIHPGPLPHFGGEGMHGHHVHEAVLAAYKDKKITHSAVSMHFVTAEYDRGPKFLEVLVPCEATDTVDDLQKRVNVAEHRWQAPITNMVVTGQIHWDGVNPESLVKPEIYDLD